VSRLPTHGAHGVHGALAAAIVILSGCVVGLPKAGSGSTTIEAVPTRAFPVAWNGTSGSTAQLAQSGDDPGAGNTPPPGPGADASPMDKLAIKQGAPQRTSYAVIIGIEHYRDIPAAPGAAADAQSIEQTLLQGMQIPKENERTLVDAHATHSDIEQALDWLVAAVPAGGRAYFYFSGHGTPAVKDASAMLVPYEATDTGLATVGIPVSHILQRLSETKGHESLAVLDSCFSGAGGRSVLPKGARPLIRVKDTTPIAKSAVALFSAAGGNEISGPTKDGRQGLFTHNVAMGLGSGEADLDGDGQITLAELQQYVSPRVAREAKEEGRDQHPSLSTGALDPKNVALVWGIRR
jgi:hypothetical protein